MFIYTIPETFIPKNFVILDFYGNNTCIAWNQNELICLPYIYKDSTEKLQVIKAPAIIKDVHGFNERVFILCSPVGIYKLTSNYGFICVSQTGIDFAIDFNEVFTINNGSLILENKILKTSKHFISISTYNVHAFSLNYKKTDNVFYNLFLPDNCQNCKNLCLISVNNKLYKIIDQTIHIIYNCDYLINEIKSVEKHDKVMGLFLKTDTNTVIFIHTVDNKLKYDKICLEVNIRTVTAVIDTNFENELIIVYSDDTKTYYTRRNIIEGSVQEIQIDEKQYESIKIYKSLFLVYLSNSKELLQISIAQLRNLHFINTNYYVPLQSHMLQGLEKITTTICNRTMELKSLQDHVIKIEDILKRINLFVSKQNIKFFPDNYIKILLKQTFLISNFQKILPNNSIIVKRLKMKKKTIFSMKNVKDCDTIIEMPIFTPILTSRLYIGTDLITYKNDKEIWCLIKNYIQNPVTSKSKRLYLTTSKYNLIKHKLFVLNNLIQAKNISLEEIYKIKNDVRIELQL